MSAQDTSAEAEPDLRLEIAHLLLIDVVGYSRLLVNEQIELLQELNQIVRNTGRFRAAEAHGKLIRLPTGDWMALLFFQSPEEPAHCALEISQALQSHPHTQLRVGSTAFRSVRLQMSTTDQISRDQASTWPSASWIAAMPGSFGF